LVYKFSVLNKSSLCENSVHLSQLLLDVVERAVNLEQGSRFLLSRIVCLVPDLLECFFRIRNVDGCRWCARRILRARYFTFVLRWIFFACGFRSRAAICSGISGAVWFRIRAAICGGISGAVWFRIRAAICCGISGAVWLWFFTFFLSWVFLACWFRCYAMVLRRISIAINNFCLSAVGCTGTFVVTDTSLVVISGVDGVRSLPFDCVTTSSIPMFIEVGEFITIASSWECVLLSTTSHCALVFTWKIKVFEESLVILDSIRTAGVFKSLSTFLATIDDICCDTKALADSCASIGTCRHHESCGHIMDAWLRSLWCHVEP
jgi:hypothetical protein